MDQTSTKKPFTTVKGTSVLLDTSDEAIMEACVRNGFPALKYGEQVEVTFPPETQKGRKIATILGAANCEKRSPECCKDCPFEENGMNMLWASYGGSNGNVAFIHPIESKVRPLSVNP